MCAREKNAILCFLRVFVQVEGKFSRLVSWDCVFTPVRKSRKVKWQRGKVVGDFYFLGAGWCDLILARLGLQIETSINIHE